MNLNFEEFLTVAKTHSLVPLYSSLPADLDTPVSAFLKLKSDRLDFLFESVVGGEKWARYSFLGTGIKRLYTLSGDHVAVTDAHGVTFKLPFQNSPFEVLRDEFKDLNAYQDPKLPRFFGGYVGYFGYDIVNRFEKISEKNGTDSLSDFMLMLADDIVIFDNLDQEMRVVSCVMIPQNAHNNEAVLHDLYGQACIRISRIKEKLKHNSLDLTTDHNPVMGKVTQNQNEQVYCKHVRQAKDYIEAGDIFQVVLSLRCDIETQNLDPFEVYRAIRRINPSPYMYYLRFDDLKIIGASPELLVRVEDGVVEVRPIAGTRKRGQTPQQDLKLEQELKTDPKERAEHVMLVDLGRNDIGRVAKTGTVSVDENEVVERYSHVMHLVSHVSGELRDDLDVFDAIQATFPAGTLSGAPKIRAMQIIDELEPDQRGLYGGAVGYVSFTGNTDLAITIRTAVMQGDMVTVQAGAGIVYNSVPEKEYEECQNKAKAMLKALQSACDPEGVA